MLEHGFIMRDIDGQRVGFEPCRLNGAARKAKWRELIDNKPEGVAYVSDGRALRGMREEDMP